MKRINLLAAGLIAFALVGSTAPAMAQTQLGPHEIHAYAGWLLGDDLTERAVSGQTPQLDDEIVGGLRYGFNFTDSWGLEASVGYAPSTVTEFAGPAIDIDLLTADLDAVWHLRRDARLIPYVVGGIGYAQADLDRTLLGTVDGQSVSIDDDGGFSANIGVGLKYFATDHLILRVDARYRYVDVLVDPYGDSLSCAEATVGIGWRF